MQKVEKSDSRLNGTAQTIPYGMTSLLSLVRGRCSPNWAIRCRGCFKKNLLRVRRQLWLKPQAANRRCRATVLEVRNDQQAPCNCNHVLRYRHGEVWDMRPKDQNMAGFFNHQCPYKSADNTDDSRNEQLSTSACRECDTA